MYDIFIHLLSASNKRGIHQHSVSDKLLFTSLKKEGTVKFRKKKMLLDHKQLKEIRFRLKYIYVPKSSKSTEHF